MAEALGTSSSKTTTFLYTIEQPACEFRGARSWLQGACDACRLIGVLDTRDKMGALVFVRKSRA
jgi:hypothetical protein